MFRNVRHIEMFRNVPNNFFIYIRIIYTKQVPVSVSNNVGTFGIKNVPEKTKANKCFLNIKASAIMEKLFQ